jgi:transcriptional regulator with XRE-family HTH domain
MTLTSAPDADLSQILTKHDLVAALQVLRRRTGLTYVKIEQRSTLSRATAGDVLTGRSPLTLPLLNSLLAAFDVPADQRSEWVDAWQRVMVDTPPEAGRFEAAKPRDLGIHSAITTPDTDGDLPAYVERDFDFRLKAVLSNDLPNRGCFVVLVGGSSTGKTRSLYEAVDELMPHWWLVQPSDTGELLDLKNRPPRQTIFWLDELQRYLGSHPPLTSECVLAFIRNGNIVVGTLWPDRYNAYMADSSDDITRLLKIATHISVPERLTEDELLTAGEVATTDSRIRAALDVKDASLTQVLAGGPRLVMRWEQPPSRYTGAMITAAADAHRLGVQAPLTRRTLAETMLGYLSPADRVEPQETWLPEALQHARERLYGDVSALVPADDGRTGKLVGYTVADYLAQHLRRHRRNSPVPDSAWRALIARADNPADLRRLANSATARLRHCYAKLALERLAREFNHAAAATELADLLIGQDRFEPAVEILSRHLAANPSDRFTGRHLARTRELWQRVDDLRPAANAGDPAARERIAEIRVDCGECDDLRARAATGDVLAAERLVERLVDRGRRRELIEWADRGNGLAAAALADLYAAWGEVALLQARADAGDRAAELRLSKVDPTDADGAAAEIAALRAGADAGRSDDARQLCTRLFELRDEHQLWLETQAGTLGAADRLIALYTAEESVPPERVVDLRTFGLDADGNDYVLAPPRPTHRRRDP